MPMSLSKPAVRPKASLRRPPSFLAAGPESIAELYEYPKRHVIDLASGPCGCERMDRLRFNLQKGQWISEDYAGMGCTSMAYHFGQRALQELGITPESSEPFRVWRAGDINPICQQVLGANPEIILTPSDRPLHVTTDLNCRLSDDMRRALDMLEPGADSSESQKKKHYEIIKEVLEKADDEFGSSAVAQCVVHGKLCPLHPPKFQPVSVALTKDAAQPISDAEPLSESDRPWTSSEAGHTCVGWSARGKREGESHSSNRPFAIWTSERSKMTEDLVHGECTADFPPKVLHDAVKGDKRKLLTVWTGPQLVGWPHRRQRVFNCLLNCETTVWVGPSDVNADFHAVFGRVCSLDGSVLCVASDEEVYAYMRSKLRRGLAPPAGVCGAMSSILTCTVS